VFFVAGGERPQDPDSLLRHADGSLRLREAWVEAGPKLAHLIVSLGARECGRFRAGRPARYPPSAGRQLPRHRAEARHTQPTARARR